MSSSIFAQGVTNAYYFAYFGHTTSTFCQHSSNSSPCNVPSRHAWRMGSIMNLLTPYNSKSHPTKRARRELHVCRALARLRQQPGADARPPPRRTRRLRSNASFFFLFASARAFSTLGTATQAARLAQTLASAGPIVGQNALTRLHANLATLTALRCNTCCIQTP